MSLILSLAEGRLVQSNCIFCLKWEWRQRVCVMVELEIMSCMFVCFHQHHWQRSGAVFVVRVRQVFHLTYSQASPCELGAKVSSVTILDLSSEGAGSYFSLQREPLQQRLDWEDKALTIELVTLVLAQLGDSKGKKTVVSFQGSHWETVVRITKAPSSGLSCWLIPQAVWQPGVLLPRRNSGLGEYHSNWISTALRRNGGLQNQASDFGKAPNKENWLMHKENLFRKLLRFPSWYSDRQRGENGEGKRKHHPSLWE